MTAPTARRRPGPAGTLGILGTLVLLGGCVTGVWFGAFGGCDRYHGAQGHEERTARKPIARELAPLGEVVRVHWFEFDPSGCTAVPGEHSLARKGIAQLTPDAVRRLRGAYPWDRASEGPLDREARYADPATDPDLAPFLPAHPHWLSTDALEPEDSRVHAWYRLDLATGVAVFASEVYPA